MSIIINLDLENDYNHVDLTKDLNDKWATKRPDQLSPLDFIQLTVDIYGEANEMLQSNASVTESGDVSSRENYASEIIWRRSVNVKLDESQPPDEGLDLGDE